MIYVLLYVFLAVTCFAGAKFNCSAENDVLKIQKNANALRGLFAIFIIWTHCTMAFPVMPSLIVPLRKVSTFGVGFFFVLSGYGLALSFDRKPNYLNGFIVNKLIKKIIFAAVLCRCISKTLLVLLLGDSSWMTIIQFIVGINWYIHALVVLYLLFYFIYRFVNKKELRIFMIWVAVIAITIALYLIHIKNIAVIDRSFFISEWAFPFGITIYEMRDRIEKLMTSYRVLTFIVMFLLLGVTFVLAAKATSYSMLDLVSHNLMLFPFYYFVMLLCKYFTLGNPILGFLNKISFELYLYQFVILKILKEYMPTIDFWYFVIATVITIVLAFVVNFTVNALKKFF